MAVALSDSGLPLQHPAPAPPPPDPDGVSRELLLPSLHRAAGLTLLIGYGWFLAGLVDGDRAANWWQPAPSALLAVLAGLSALAGRRYSLALAALLAGLVSAALVDAGYGNGQVAPWLAMSAALTAGLLAAPPWLSALGGLAAAVALVALPWPLAWPLLRAATCGLALSWAVGGNLYRVLSVATRREAHAWQQAQEAQRRRGELQRTSKALRDMYALLERTNRELEVARREAEEARAIKARFAASISHELRTPLNLIMGFSRIMHRSPHVYGNVNWTPELRSDVRQVYDASRHLLGMIDDILDLSRIEAQRLPLKLEPVSLPALAQEAADTARGLLRGSAVTLEVEAPAAMPEIMLDQTRIRQVLLNLLTNAIRFTDSGSIRLKLWQEDGQAYLAVTDTGAGIPADQLGTIFEEFSQADGSITAGRGGAGLGLAVCKQFVQLHGGTIHVESTLDQGSTFTVSLPMQPRLGGRERLVYYVPEGWSPPLPANPLGDCIAVLSSQASAARLVARGIANHRVVPVPDLAALAAAVEREHPLGVVLLVDPLQEAAGPTAEDVWATTGRPDLGVVECELPIEETARRQLAVDAYLTKPVDPAVITAEIGASGAQVATVLAVDDDPGFLAMLERVTKASLPSARVHTCGTARAALELCRRRRFDVVVLDLVMPGGGGAQFLRQARREGLLSGTRLVVATGATYSEDLASLSPVRLRFARKEQPRSDAWLGCLTEILSAAPPDYSLPAHRRDTPPAPPR